MTDISYWTNLNPQIKYEPTRKKYYDQYFCRLVLTAPAAMIINDPNNDDLGIALAQRTSVVRNINYGGTWGISNPRLLIDQADLGQLEILQQIKNDYKNIKIRVEEPWVQLYSVDELELRALATRFNKEQCHKLIYISFPKNDEHKKLLDAGHILTKTSNNFKYKIYIRDGYYSKEIKQQLLSFLTNIDSEVKVSAGTTRMLLSNHSYVWGCFLYANDPNISTFMSLIGPNIIRKIHELTTVE
jgi:hypothetical protein